MLKQFINRLFKNRNYSRFVINSNAVIIALEAETKRRLGHFDDALCLINQAIEAEKNNDMYYVTKSLIFYDKKQYTQALQEIKKAIKINNKVKRYKDIEQKIINCIN